MTAQIPIRQPIPFTEIDPVEEAFEALREECEREFDEWRGLDWHNREFEDFSEWLTRMAQPHMRDAAKYAAAMNWRERERVDPASLDHGLRSFVRQGVGR